MAKRKTSGNHATTKCPFVDGTTVLYYRATHQVQRVGEERVRTKALTYSYWTISGCFLDLHKHCTKFSPTNLTPLQKHKEFSLLSTLSRGTHFKSKKQTQLSTHLYILQTTNTWRQNDNKTTFTARLPPLQWARGLPNAQACWPDYVGRESTADQASQHNGIWYWLPTSACEKAFRRNVSPTYSR
jgi:hypothetical protein